MVPPVLYTLLALACSSTPPDITTAAPPPPQAVIQGYFREWLNASNNIRQVYDLSKLEQEEGGQGQGAAGQAGHS